MVSPVRCRVPVAVRLAAVMVLFSASAFADKAPEVSTIGSPVPLSAAQQAALAAKAKAALPAAEVRADAALKASGTFVARVAPAPDALDTPRDAAGAAPERPRASRPIPITAWTVSPALGPIPRPEWSDLLRFKKPMDQSTIATPRGQTRVPHLPEGVPPDRIEGDR